MVCTNYLVLNAVKISWPSLILMRLYTFVHNLIKMQALYNISSVRYEKVVPYCNGIKCLVVGDGSHCDLTFWV